MGILDFLYQFFFIDQEQKRLSHTKFWSHVGYAVMTWVIIHAQLTGKVLATDFYFFMASVLIGNRTILKVISLFKGKSLDLSK